MAPPSHKLLLSTFNAHFRPLSCGGGASSSSPTHPGRIAPYPPDLIRWVRREGGVVHQGLKMADVDALGLGLVASQEIPKGSELIALPNHIPLSFRDSHAGDGANGALAELARRVPEELWAMRLALKLLQERAKAGSFWWPYISNLPEAFSVPIFFSGDEIKALQYAPLLHQVNKRCRFLLDFEREVEGVVGKLQPNDHPFGGQHVDASALGWAMSAVSSRAFLLHGEIQPDRRQLDVPMLLPLIDMCNHSFHPNAQIVQEKDSRYLVKVVAETEIEPNTPLALNYGCLSNDLLLLDYGFVIPSNPYDYVELTYDGDLLDAASMSAGVSSPAFSSPAQWQLEPLCQLNLHGAGAFLKVRLGGPELIDGRLLAALRVLLATDVEAVQKHDLSSLKSLEPQAPLGASNEVAALRTVIALCVIALGHFPTKIMQDESELKKEISSSMRLAVEFRIEKKSTIIDIMTNVTRKVNMLMKEKTAA